MTTSVICLTNLVKPATADPRPVDIIQRMAIIAVGYPGSPTSANPWDWWPLVGFALSLWFIRSVLGRALGVIVLVLCLFAGLMFATAVHAWGVLGGATIGLVLAAVAVLFRRRDPRATLPSV
jgi:hypothetical protein